MKFLLLLSLCTLGLTSFAGDLNSKGIFGARITEKYVDQSLQGKAKIYGKVVHNGVNGVDSALVIVEGVDSVYSNDTGYFELYVMPGTYTIISRRDYYLEEKADSVVIKKNHVYEGWFSHGQIEAAYFKPAIYLYNDFPLHVTLSLEFNGVLDFTYPKSNGSWEADITESGQLSCEGKLLDYIYWDGRFSPAVSASDLHSGSIVMSGQVISFLEKALKDLGLNEKEKQDFISFWGPKLVKHDASYVHFATASYQAKVPLIVTPEPDHVIRIFMVYAPAEVIDFTPVPQKFSPEQRNGFTVVEWGGGPLNKTIIKTL